MLMAFVFRYSLFSFLIFISLVANFCYCFHPKLLNVSKHNTRSRWSSTHPTRSRWSSTRASWYGNPSGAGNDGGGCGYQNAVEQKPFSSLVTAAASSLYNSGKGCGTCFQVKCTKKAACSGKPVTVVITDVCSGCDGQSSLFDLSGTAFGSMAASGKADQLRNIGIEQIQYRSGLQLSGVSVTFRVDPGSTANYFATALSTKTGMALPELSLNGRRTLAAIGSEWNRRGVLFIRPICQTTISPPFSIRLIGGGNSKKTLVANSVIPANYSPERLTDQLSTFDR